MSTSLSGTAARIAFLLLFAAGVAAARGVWESIPVAELPSEARHTLELIAAGGPYPYWRDGTIFANREQRLPVQGRGYYHEYTVRTPGFSTRGARRIICGGPPRSVAECYYTNDHYESFIRIRQ